MINTHRHNIFLFKNTLVSGLGASNMNVRKYLTDTTEPERYKRSLLKLKVYFEAFNYESVVESPKYTVSMHHCERRINCECDMTKVCLAEFLY